MEICSQGPPTAGSTLANFIWCEYPTQRGSFVSIYQIFSFFVQLCLFVVLFDFLLPIFINALSTSWFSMWDSHTELLICSLTHTWQIFLLQPCLQCPVSTIEPRRVTHFSTMFSYLQPMEISMCSWAKENECWPKMGHFSELNSELNSGSNKIRGKVNHSIFVNKVVGAFRLLCYSN